MRRQNQALAEGKMRKLTKRIETDKTTLSETEKRDTGGKKGRD